MDSILCLFDVDGTLTAPRSVIEDDMKIFLEKLKTKVTVGLVGGSDINKIAEQMYSTVDELVAQFTYVFSENGLVAFKDGKNICTQSIHKHLGEELVQKLINFSLRYMSDIQLPCKRGTFIEYRNGMINICPPGRSCSLEERLQFYELDKVEAIRQKFVSELNDQFSACGLEFAIGGQISIDAYPTHWNKTYCLNHCQNDFKVIHFFGDKTTETGNDYALYVDDRVTGHSVQNPHDTIRQCQQIFFK